LYLAEVLCTASCGLVNFSCPERIRDVHRSRRYSAIQNRGVSDLPI